MEEWTKEIADARCETRRLGDMADVLYDRQFVKSANLSAGVYYVYRNIPFSSQTNMPPFSELRYDITTVASLMLGREYRKTYGHYHAIGASGLPHAEIYEVLQGMMHVLLQKMEEEKITDVCLVEASLGDKVEVPPGYGHLLINPGTEMLVTGNLVSRRCKQSNEPFRKMHGAAYYELSEHHLVRNLSYGEVPNLRIEAPNTRFPKNRALRHLLLKDPERFRFLIDPILYPSMRVSGDMDESHART